MLVGSSYSTMLVVRMSSCYRSLVTGHFSSRFACVVTDALRASLFVGKTDKTVEGWGVGDSLTHRCFDLI